MLELAIFVVTIVLFVRDWRKEAPSARASAIAREMRKLRERAEVAADVAPTRSEAYGYRDVAVPEIIEPQPGFFARMRARRRAKQMLAMERR